MLVAGRLQVRMDQGGIERAHEADFRSQPKRRATRPFSVAARFPTVEVAPGAPGAEAGLWERSGQREGCLGVEVLASCPDTAEDLQPPLASDDLAPGPALGGVGFVPWFDEGFAPAGRPVRHRFVRTDGAETPRRPAGKDMGPPPGLGRGLQRGIHATGLAEAGGFWECRAEMTARPAVSVSLNHGFPRSRAAHSVSWLARPVQ
jgi:hypothetical protein